MGAVARRRTTWAVVVLGMMLAGCGRMLVRSGPHVAATAVRVGTLPLGDGIVAKDLGFSVANDTTVRYFFGDTLGLFNADGTIASNSGAQAPRDHPFAAVAFPGGQVVPFTPAEAAWNLRREPSRWAVPIMGAVPEGDGDARLFYAVDQPPVTGGSGGRAFYALFPMRWLGTTVLPAGAEVAVRDERTELWLASHEWPAGFHRLADGRVRFYLQETSDADPMTAFRRATWSADRGFEVEATPLFVLDAVAGLTVFQPGGAGRWLAAWIDSQGVVRLAEVDGDGRPARAAAEVHRIPRWTRAWDGYAVTHVDGADDGRSFHLVYSRALGLLRSELPILRVTLE